MPGIVAAAAAGAEADLYALVQQQPDFCQPPAHRQVAARGVSCRCARASQTAAFVCGYVAEMSDSHIFFQPAPFFQQFQRTAAVSLLGDLHIYLLIGLSATAQAVARGDFSQSIKHLFAV